MIVIYLGFGVWDIGVVLLCRVPAATACAIAQEML